MICISTRFYSRIISLLIVLLCLSQVSIAADKRPITETDLFKFEWIADPQISPDGSRIVFTRVTVNQKADRYDTALWILSTSGGAPRQLTAGPRDSGPRWSPDGKFIGFNRVVEKDSRSNSQLHLLSLDGGEAMPLTDMPRGVGNFEWSPNGKTIAFTASEDLSKKEDKETAVNSDAPASKDKQPERVSDVRVINKAIYRFNGSGYLNPKVVSHIWSVTVTTVPGEVQKTTQLTKGKFSEGNIEWTPDGSRIYFISQRIDEPYYESPHTDLFSIKADGSDEVKVLGFDGGFGSYSISNNGKQIAFVGSHNPKQIQSYTQSDLFIINNVPGATPKNMTLDYDFDLGDGIGGDQHTPRGGNPGGIIWSKDDRSIFIKSGQHGSENLKRIDAAAGKVESVTTGNHEVISYTTTADTSKFVMSISTPVNIGDLFLLDTNSGKMQQLTDINKDLFSQLNLTTPEEIWYTSFDGKKIQGWILKPPSFDPTKKYQFILEIHGGPHAAYGNTFTHEFQWMAAKGYVVLYTNPRGSTTYGQDFGNIIQYNYPGDDYKDLMAGVDEVVKRGYIDTNKLGVTGGSGGGVLTNWTVGHTNRFAAAVSQRSIADWAGFWYTADFTLFQPSWFRGTPWEEPKDFSDRSPITYIKNVKTPMMFIEGEVDWRTPANEGGEAMFRALKYLKVPTTMVRFPNESHELSRSGAPWHRVERLQHILNWFDKYLQDKPIKIYDVE